MAGSMTDRLKAVPNFLTRTGPLRRPRRGVTGPPMREQTGDEIGRFYGDGADDRWKVHPAHGTKRIETGHRYHQRSLAESGMARDKRILGPPPAARSWKGQQTEGRIGCRAYSIG